MVCSNCLGKCKEAKPSHNKATCPWPGGGGYDDDDSTSSSDADSSDEEEIGPLWAYLALYDLSEGKGDDLTGKHVREACETLSCPAPGRGMSLKKHAASALESFGGKVPASVYSYIRRMLQSYARNNRAVVEDELSDACRALKLRYSGRNKQELVDRIRDALIDVEEPLAYSGTSGTDAAAGPKLGAPAAIRPVAPLRRGAAPDIKGLSRNGDDEVRVKVAALNCDAYQYLAKDHNPRFNSDDALARMLELLGPCGELGMPPMVGLSEVGPAGKLLTGLNRGSDYVAYMTAFTSADKTVVAWQPEKLELVQDSVNIFEADTSYSGTRSSRRGGSMSSRRKARGFFESTEGKYCGGIFEDPKTRRSFLALSVHLPKTKATGRDTAIETINVNIEELSEGVDGVLLFGDFNGTPSKVQGELGPKAFAIAEEQATTQAGNSIDNLISMMDGLSFRGARVHERITDYTHYPITAEVVLSR